MVYGPIPMAVVQKLGCTVPQVFKGEEVQHAVLTADAGLCRLVPLDEAVHRVVDPNGSCGIVLTNLGRDELTAMLNACHEGHRKPPYTCRPLTYSRIRLR